MLENFKQRLADYAQTRSSQNALADETISITYAQLWETRAAVDGCDSTDAISAYCLRYGK